MNNKLAGKHIPYHPFIDGLRALAVLAVVFFHLNSNLLPGGFVGVDVFFVISGFIVSASVAAFKGATILQFFAIFYSRRIKRIFPALIFMLLVVFLLSTAFIPGSWLSWVNQSTGYYAFFGFSNFILASTGRDYFAPTTDFNPFTHTWSLGVEEQFYLIFPFLYIFWLSSKKRYLSSVIYLCLGVASLVYSFKLSATEPTQAYYFTASRFWELASGVLLYQFMSAFRQQLNSQHRVIWFRRIISVISLAGLLISFIITDTNRFPMPGALLATVSTLGLLFSLYDGVAPSIVNSLLSNRFLRFIGKLSFSLYLWHWPVFVLFRWTYGLEKNSQQLLALLIAVLFSLFSYLVIEKPVRNARFIAQRNNWIVLFTGVVVIGISYLAAAKIDSRVGKISQSVLTKFPQDWYPEGSGVVEGYPGCQAEPEHVDVNGGLLLIYKVKGCDKPASPNPHQIFVIGDSHALAYSGLFKSFAIKTQTTIFAYNNGGCPFLSFTPERDMDVPQCQKYSDSSLQDIIKRVKPGDILFLASLRLPRFVDQWAYFGDRQHADILFSERAEKGRERTVDYAKEALKPFVDKGVHIIFEAPKPLFKIPVYRCADWFNKSNPICKGGDSISREVIENYRAPILASYSELGKTIPLDVWDPLPTLCGESKCSAYKNGKPLFFDGDHLSGYGNKTLFPSFTRFVNSVESGNRQQITLSGKKLTIDFTQPTYPSYVEDIEGLSQHEAWGRWSDQTEAEKVSISFKANLPKHFVITLKGHAFGPNIGKDIKISYSGVYRTVRLQQDDTIQSIEFNSNEQSNEIVIMPPAPTTPQSLNLGEDKRMLGMGFVSLDINEVK